MIKATAEDLSDHPEWFYRDRENQLYPYYKSEIKEKVNPCKPDTFLPILKEMDYPFLEEIWLQTLEYVILKNGDLKCVFGKYIAKMGLCSYSRMRFKDSQYNRDIVEYRPIINWKIVTKNLWLSE